MHSNFYYFIISLLTTLSVLFPFTGYAFDNQFQCKCSTIGIDSLWADTSTVLCYKIPVNQIYGNDKSGKLYLSAICAKKTGRSEHDPLLYLHGGPGLVTLDNAQRYLNDPYWQSLRENHDIIMFDYRGTGYSEPSICEDILDSLANFEKSNPSQDEYKLKKMELYLECSSKLTAKQIDLNGFTSFQMAADAEEIRKALQIQNWNLYGISYGTMVSLLYIRHFSESVKSAILDSPFPPNAPSFDFVRTMNSALQTIQIKVSENVLTNDKRKDVIENFKTIASRLDKEPAKFNGADFNGEDFANAMVSAFYKTDVVPLIPLALYEFAQGNDSLLQVFVDNMSSTEAYGKYNEIQSALITCFECKPRTSDETPESLESAYPHLASLSMADDIELCYSFRPERPDSSFYLPVKSDIPVLVMVGEYDPGTPPFYAEAAVEKLSNATLIVASNASHAVMYSSDCVFNTMKSFVEDPSIKPDLSCLQGVEEIKFITKDLKRELETIQSRK